MVGTIFSHVEQTRRMGTEFDALAQGHTARDGARFQVQAAWLQGPDPLHSPYVTCIGTSVPPLPSHSAGPRFSGCDTLRELPGHWSLALPGDAALLTLQGLGSHVFLDRMSHTPAPAPWKLSLPLCSYQDWFLSGLPGLLTQRMAERIVRRCMNRPQKWAWKRDPDWGEGRDVLLRCWPHGARAWS